MPSLLHCSMETFTHYATEATTSFQRADHLTYVTYPLINDPKLLPTIIDLLHKAIHHAIAAFLSYDAYYKRIPEFPTQQAQQLHTFKYHTVPRYGLPKDLALLINHLDDYVAKRQQSPLEFSRKDKYVIASRTYRIQTLNIDTIKKHVNQTRSFIQKLNEVHRASDRRFN